MTVGITDLGKDLLFPHSHRVHLLDEREFFGPSCDGQNACALTKGCVGLKTESHKGKRVSRC